MTGAQIITQTMEQFPENELIFASKLYADQLCKAVSEETYYQTLGRMCKAGSLCRIAKGTYYRPKTSKYGIVPPSQKEIVAAFTEPDKGTVVGYSLYNSLKLTRLLKLLRFSLPRSSNAPRTSVMFFCSSAIWCIHRK